ncbi:SPOR domain-containing protein [Colwellia sp. D2M02]|uniref:SPOR domain-containing protein n=1 Tax=Colwellia sp. D2M02 TaxID=2841562 RepID=UPI001C085112|nr:SPOR domain-containing protein [Colwellia sp. D2M02]MBU2893915.1 SPOR domain-containing protein [Colwellia sp. D2M02]
MSTPFKNRLVGTVIVAAVLVIFLPDILDGKKKSYQDDFEAIPQAPAFSGEKTSKSFPNEKITYKPDIQETDEVALDDIDNQQVHATDEDVVVLEQSQAGNKLQVTPAKIEQPITTVPPNENTNGSEEPKRLPEKAIAKEAWVIHLGSFKHKKNVEQLLNKLKANGYTVFTQPIQTKQGTLTKVFIGPELIKSSLDKKLISLKELTGAQGKVARFIPNK